MRNVKKLLLSFVFALLPMMVAGEVVVDITVDGIHYRLYPERQKAYVVALEDGQKYSGDVVIPSTVAYEGVTYEVTNLWQGAFKGCTELTSVSLPNTMTGLWTHAFKDCTKLTSITLPDSLKSIGAYSFYGCTALTSVTIPVGVKTIGNDAFNGCTALTSIALPDSLETIDEYSFYGCTGLTSVAVPDKVTSIGRNAFCGCSSLASVTLGNSLKEIKGAAFYKCNSLTSITLPDGLTTLGATAFYGSGLTAIVIPNSVTTMGSSNFLGCSKLASVTIGTGLTSIESRMFEECSALTTIDIPDNIKTIGDRAFEKCTSLATVSIGNGVDSIGKSAFATYNGMAVPSLPQSLTNVGDYAFNGCSGHVTISRNLTSIGKRAFNGCSDLIVESGNPKYDSRDNCHAIIETATNTLAMGCKNSVIPSSVTSIGDYAFCDCKGLTEITIPSNVTSIGIWAFLGCSDLKSLTLSEGLTTIGDYAFDGCQVLTSVTIPNSVTTIGGSAFNGCRLTSLTIPNGVTTIGGSAFDGCRLTTITIGEGVTSIGFWAFGANPLVNVICLAKSVPTTDKMAFRDSHKSANLYVPKELLDAYKAVEPWSEFKNVQPLEGSEIPVITEAVVDGINYSINTGTKTAEVRQLPDRQEYTGDIVIPSTIQYDGKTIQVTAIGKNAFLDCMGMTSVSIPNSVTEIGNMAFMDCEGLTSITIPNSVTNIGYEAFQMCWNLTSVICKCTTPPAVQLQYAFDSNIYQKAMLYVPEEAIEIYRRTQPWSQFKDIVPLQGGDIPFSGEVIINGINYFVIPATQSAEVRALPNNQRYKGDIVIPGTVEFENTTCYVTDIAESAFRYCNDITSVTIGEGVTTIGNDAFQNCSGMTSLIIASSVKTIGQNVFSGCTALEIIVVRNGNTVYDSRDNCNALIETATNTLMKGCNNSTIPASVTSIYNNAFYSCTGLTSVTIPASVTTIGSGAFIGCTGLTSVVVESGNAKYDSRNNCNAIIETATNRLIMGCKNSTIPESVTTICNSAFSNCKGLTEMTIPNNVTTIENNAFSGCTGLKSITIPESVKTIGSNVFKSCSNLTNIICLAKEVPTANVWTFDYMLYNKATLHVPAEALEAYKSAEPWNEFKNIVVYDPTGIAGLQTKCVTVRAEAGTLTVNGTKAGTPISVYDLSGRRLATAIAVEGTTRIECNSNVKVVVVKIGKQIEILRY